MDGPAILSLVASCVAVALLIVVLQSRHWRQSTQSLVVTLPALVVSIALVLYSNRAGLHALALRHLAMGIMLLGIVIDSTFCREVVCRMLHLIDSAVTRFRPSEHNAVSNSDIRVVTFLMRAGGFYFAAIAFGIAYYSLPATDLM